MRRRIMNGAYGEEDAVAGDILCAKEDGSKMVFKAEDCADINGSGWTPIGIVVIPPSHDVYGTGEGAAIGLLWPNTNGATSNPLWSGWGCIIALSVSNGTTIMNGTYDYDTPLTNFNYCFNVTDNTASDVISSSSYAGCYLPQENLSSYYGEGVPCYSDPITKYPSENMSTSHAYLPSPYKNGKKNPSYFLTEPELSPLTDFDGKNNTDTVYKLHNKTISSFGSNFNIGSFPLFDACYKYHTVGTNQGDWYVPAMGELGYLCVRRTTINNSIHKLQENGYLDEAVADLSINYHFWSSTEKDISVAFIAKLHDNSMSYNSKDQEYPDYVNKTTKPFIRF